MTIKANRHFKVINAITVIVALVSLVIFLPQLASFKASLATLHNADNIYIGLSIIFWVLTFFAAALVYKFISLRPLPFPRTLLIQLASGFTNRLAPMGAGIVTLNISYLMKRGHSATESGTLVATNNLLGFVGIAILLLGTAILSPYSFVNSFNVPINIPAVWILVLAVSLSIGLIAIVIFGLKQIRQLQTAAQLILRSIYKKPLRLFLALGASIAITIGYAAALYSIGLAFNVHLTIAQTLLVLTIGVVAASITPTPGGVGGAELGLTAALISAGISSHQALTVALMYRFIVYWLPILPGFLCFQVALRRHYI